MRNQRNFRSKISTKKKKAPGNNSPLEIRNPRPEELFYRTGNAELRYCACKRITAEPKAMQAWHFKPLKEPALHALIDWATPALFHEMVSETGVRFAYPQILREDPSVPAKWLASEKALFREPLYSWTLCTHGNKPGLLEYRTSFRKARCPSINPDFREQLDEALRPDLIETLEHPIVRQLQPIFADIEGNVVDQWVRIG